MTDVTGVGVGSWRTRACELADNLTTDGAITGSLWREAFQNTPRHVFVPRFWALDKYNAPTYLIDGADPAHQAEWLDAVYSDQFLATQWTPQDGRRMITSSASLPTLVARMLHLLDVQDNDRVLEIGTGTGYNTALLCHRVGDTAVASVDIDPILVAEAQARLAQIGYRPQIAAGDGAQGLQQDTPYSRILSTCASPGVPTEWIIQLATEGKIVAPFIVGGALAVLTKTGPSEVSGRLNSEQAWFMPLRPADKPLPEGYLVDQPEPPPDQRQHHGTAEVDPGAFADPDFRLWLCLHLPADARIIDIVNNDFTRTGVIVHTTEHRATAEFPAGNTASPSLITQDERRLFDTVEAAWQAWQRWGRPDRSRVGITAHTDGTQNAWLDSPTSGMTWPLPTCPPPK
ncbi:MAG: methyltransferase domain-containing protein [Pseudonocardiales bacterium]|nr:methyltransferase domain-containing protein [Pseudonocardiales bacterium]